MTVVVAVGRSAGIFVDTVAAAIVVVIAVAAAVAPTGMDCFVGE